MGLGLKNVGTFPGAHDDRFVKNCRDLLGFALKLQRPRLVLVLGRHVPRRIAAMAAALKPWMTCHSLRQIDERGLAIVEGVDVDGVGSPFTAVVLTHPSHHRLNVWRRRFRGLDGEKAETELLRMAWHSVA
jgi:uracil-DNA glycosylase